MIALNHIQSFVQGTNKKFLVQGWTRQPWVHLSVPRESLVRLMKEVLITSYAQLNEPGTDKRGLSGRISRFLVFPDELESKLLQTLTFDGMA